MHGHIRQRHSPAGGPAMVGFNTQATKMFELKYPTDYHASFFSSKERHWYSGVNPGAETDRKKHFLRLNFLMARKNHPFTSLD